MGLSMAKAGNTDVAQITEIFTLPELSAFRAAVSEDPVTQGERPLTAPRS